MSHSVYVTRGIFEEAISYLKEHADVKGNPTDRVLTAPELEASLQDVDGVLSLLTDTIDGSLMARCNRLRAIANLAVGFDNIDIRGATDRGIIVTNTPGVLTETTADFTWCLMLAVARRVVEADRYVRDGRFEAWGPRTLLGYDLFGKNLGIVGLGRIGQAVARRAVGFGMRVSFHNPGPVSARVVNELGVEAVDLKRLVGESDFITLHVPLVEGTRHLIGRSELEAMKPRAILVNTSRGPVVDERALVDALRSGTIAGAGLDVYEREPLLQEGLTSLTNIVLAPHIASSSHETRLRMSMMAAENLVLALEGTFPPNLVNPGVWEHRRT